jgi:hypothetical protein
LYTNKIGNVEEQEKFLETYRLPYPVWEEIENTSRNITSL